MTKNKFTCQSCGINLKENGILSLEPATVTKLWKYDKEEKVWSYQGEDIIKTNEVKETVCADCHQPTRAPE